MFTLLHLFFCCVKLYIPIFIFFSHFCQIRIVHVYLIISKEGHNFLQYRIIDDLNKRFKEKHELL